MHTFLCITLATLCCPASIHTQGQPLTRPLSCTISGCAHAQVLPPLTGHSTTSTAVLHLPRSCSAPELNKLHSSQGLSVKEDLGTSSQEQKEEEEAGGAQLLQSQAAGGSSLLPRGAGNHGDALPLGALGSRSESSKTQLPCCCCFCSSSSSKHPPGVTGPPSLASSGLRPARSSQFVILGAVTKHWVCRQWDGHCGCQKFPGEDA